MKTPATNFEALLGQARDCGLTQEFATAYEINVALDEADCCGGGGGTGKLVLPRGTKLGNSLWSYLPEEFDFSNQVDNDCIGMFEDCALREFTWPDTLPTQTVFMQSMFYDCANLTYVSIPALAWSQVQRSDYMFAYCTSLTEISIPTAPYLHTIDGMFSNCRALTQIIFPADMNEYYNSPINCGYTFYQCQNVKTISFPEIVTLNISGYKQTFQNCSKLENLIISHIGAGAISYAGFDTCTSLTLSSLQNILNALPETTTNYNCKLGTTNLAKLSDTDIQIATDKGWTLN